MIDARSEVGENPAAMGPGQEDIRAQWIEEGAEYPVGFRESPAHIRRRVAPVIRVQLHLE